MDKAVMMLGKNDEFLSSLSFKIKEEILIYWYLLGFSTKKLENFVFFFSNDKNSILRLYWFDLSKLLTLERLNERIKVINGNIYVYYKGFGYQYNPLTEAFYAIIMRQKGNYGLFLKLVENLVKKSILKKVNNQETTKMLLFGTIFFLFLRVYAKPSGSLE